MVKPTQKKRVRTIYELRLKLGKETLKIKDDIPFKNLVLTCIGINLIVIAAIFILRRFLPPEVPLFYALPEGEDQLGNIYLLAIPSVASIGIILLNILIGFGVKDEFLMKILVLAGVSTTIFSTITTLKIMYLVGSF